MHIRLQNALNSRIVVEGAIKVHLLRVVLTAKKPVCEC